MVQYAEDLFDKIESRTDPVARRGILQLAPGQGQSGYGRKIATDYKVRLNRGPWRRVYCCCYSNSGTVYVEFSGGQWVCFRNDENLLIDGEWPTKGYEVHVGDTVMVHGPGHLTEEKAAEWVAIYQKINPDLPAWKIYTKNIYR